MVRERSGQYRDTPGIFGNVAVIRHQGGWLEWGGRRKDLVGARLKKDA